MERPTRGVFFVYLISIAAIHLKTLCMSMNRKLAFVPFLLLVAIVLSTLLFPGSHAPADTTPINGADTAWMLTATALVLVMTPGLAFFYGGMVSRKNVLSTMLQSFICMVVITILWVT